MKESRISFENRKLYGGWMKKISLVLLFLIAGMILSADPWPGTSLASVGQSILTTSINLSPNGPGAGTNDRFEIGFSTIPIDDLADEVESISSVNLKVSDDTGKAILPADNSIYLYWKIQTAFNQIISLSWSDNLSSNTGTLDWIVYTTPYGDGVDSGDSVVTSGAAVLNRNPSDNTAFKFGTAGCQKLTVVSEPVTDAGVGIYSGTLLLTIKNI